MIVQQVLYVINGTQYLSASLTIRDQRKLHLYNGIMCDSVLNISTVYYIVENIGGIKHWPIWQITKVFSLTFMESLISTCHY